MKLEGIDPEHPSRYCVLTIAEVVGKSAIKNNIHIIVLYEIYKMYVFRLSNACAF